MFAMAFTIIYFCTYEKSEVKLESITTEESLLNVTYDEPQDVLEEGVLGVLSIEKIGLIASVKEGSNSEILKHYIGHIEETSIYDGNVGLAAHNRGNEYSYFARLNELESGDKLIYQTRYGTKEYEVTEKKVIEETDWSMLQDTKDNRLTMITCIKNKENYRLCVQAVERRRIKQDEESF